MNEKNNIKEPKIVPQRDSIGSKFLQKVSIWKVDESLRKRAEWMINKLKMEKYLSPLMQKNKNGEIEKGVTILSVGAGKGHELEEVANKFPKSGIIGVDPHDYMTSPVKKRIETAGHDVCYLEKQYSAEDMRTVSDKSVNAIMFNFVLHHIDENNHEIILQELNRVIKDDGYLFVAEDLVDSEEEHKKVQKIDRMINFELKSSNIHNYRNIGNWTQFFEENGFKLIEVNEESSKSGVRHGFFVFQKTTQ